MFILVNEVLSFALQTASLGSSFMLKVYSVYLHRDGDHMHTAHESTVRLCLYFCHILSWFPYQSEATKRLLAVIHLYISVYAC